MNHEPEMIYRTARRQMMTSYVPPLRRRIDSDKRTSLGWWGAISELAGFALLEYLASPVVGIAVLVVSFCLDVFAAMSGLFRRGANALDGKKRKTQK